MAILALLCAEIAGSMWAAVAAATFFATSPTWWSQCTFAEVYALNILLFALVLWIWARWDRLPSFALWVAGSYALGLGVAHHLTILCVVPGAIAMVVLQRGRARGRMFAALLVCLAIGTSLYLSLWAKAASGPLYNFGHLESGASVLYHMRGGIYAGRLLAPWDDGWGSRFAALFPAVAHDIGWWGWGAGVIGLALSWRRRLPAALLIAAPALILLLYATSYRIVDVQVYLLGIECALVVGVAIFLAAVTARLGRAAPGVLVAAAVLIAVGSGWARWPAVSLHASHITADYLTALGDAATAHDTRPATLFVGGDTELFGLHYATLVEKRWPHLRLIDPTGTLGESVPETGATFGDRRNAFLAATRHVVYFTQPPADLPTGWHALQEGLLYRAVRDGDSAIATDAWRAVPASLLETSAHVVPEEERWARGSVCLLRAIDALAHADTVTAVRYADAVSRWQADVPEARASLSRLFVQAGQFDRAQREAHAAFERAPDKNQARVWLIDTDLSTGDTLAALALYEGLAANLDAAGAARIASVYMVRRNFSAALHAVQPGVDGGWADADGYRVHGEALLRTGDVQGALNSLGRSNDLRPDDVRTLVSLALARMANGDAAGAVAGMRRAAALDPRAPVPRKWLAAYGRQQAEPRGPGTLQ